MTEIVISLQDFFHVLRYDTCYSAVAPVTRTECTDMMTSSTSIRGRKPYHRLAPWAELEIVARLLGPGGGPDLLAVNPPHSFWKNSASRDDGYCRFFFFSFG
jgi:hypothetical protein